jgi:hypothetical protein
MGEQLVALLARRYEQRLAGAHNARHRHVLLHREALPLLEQPRAVAAQREELDRPPVGAQDADRAGPRLCRDQALRQDRIENLLRRDRPGEGLGDTLEAPRAVVAIARFGIGERLLSPPMTQLHRSASAVRPLRSCSRSPRSTRPSTSSTSSPMLTGSNGLTT